MKNRISGAALMCLLVVSRVTASFFHSPASGAGQSTTADLGGAFIYLAALAVLFVPSVMLSSRCGGALVGDSGIVSRPALRIVLILATLFFLFAACVSTAKFDVFITTEVFPTAKGWFFSVLVAVFAGYAASRGLEGLGRASVLFAILMTAAVVMVFVLCLPASDTLALITPRWYTTESMLGSAVSMVANSAELVLLPFVCVRTSRISRVAACSALWWTVLLVLIATANIITSGGVGVGSAFPYYTAADVARTGTGTSMQALVTGIWFIGVFVKVSVFIALAAECVTKVFPFCKSAPTVWITAAGIAFVSGIASSSDAIRRLLAPGPVMAGIVIGFGFVLPLAALLFTRKVKEEKPL